MKPLKSLCLAAAGVAVCATANAELGTVMSPRTLNEFLARDYYVQAKRENDVLDIKDSKIMMERSAAALRGERVYPVRLDGISYVGASPEELRNARTRLVRVLRDSDTVNTRTEAVSHAQVMFDCWAVQQQAGPNASHNLYQCKDKFLRTIAMLDKGERPVVAAPVKWRVVKAFNVYFDWDKAEIRPDARTTLDEIKATMADPRNQTKRIAIGGHTDASGSGSYNQALSERRVRAVADYLNVTPLSAKEIDLRAFGENKLPVPTADGVRLQANRVAKIAIVEIEE